MGCWVSVLCRVRFPSMRERAWAPDLTSDVRSCVNATHPIATGGLLQACFWLGIAL